MTTWASHAIAELAEGRQTVVKPHGNSMLPRIKSGDAVVVDPIDDPASLACGDVVLVRVSGRDYLHLISAADEKRLQISNNRGGVNGWVPRLRPYGKAQV